MIMRVQFLVRGSLIPNGPLVALWLLLIATVPVPAMAANPAVVVSIKPLHSIVSSVMQGVAQPVLLTSGAASPHGFALKPSQARLLQDADAIFWVGADLERFLVKPLQTLPRHAQVIAVSKTLKLLSFRDGGTWTSDDHTEGHATDKHAHHDDHGTKDPHFWLDPVRVKSILSIVVRTLSEIDAEHAALYQANGEALSHRLDALDKRLQQKLTPVRTLPYLVFHDAYQYFEKRYGLQAVGTIRLDPEYRPGARHLTAIQRRIAEGDIRCVFREPQFHPPALNKGTAFGALRIAVLDPLGAQHEAGADAYFHMMDGLANSVTMCLASES